ncbi:MAG: PAS domain S-box protein [Syntrophaceae bacterium]|nr:PAS domain S-box protein [Syntrophaceae bacterium]
MITAIPLSSSLSIYRRISHLLIGLVLCIVLPAACALFSADTASAENTLTAEEKNWLEENPDKLVLLFNTDSPPIEFVSETGEFIGLAADIIALIEKNLGISFVKHASNDRSGNLIALKDGVCAVLPALALTTEREGYVQFTDPYVSWPIVIITGPGIGDDLGLSDLGGKRVAVLSGHSLEGYLRNRNNDLFEVVPMPDVAHALRATSFGQVDAYVENLATAAHHIEKENIPHLRIAGVIESQRVRIGISKKYPLLASSVDKSLSSIPEKDIETVRKKWISLKFNAGWSPETVRLLIAIVVFVGLLALGLVVISYVLKRRLREKMAGLEAARLKISEQENFLDLAADAAQAGIWDLFLAKNEGVISSKWFSMLGYQRDTERMPLHKFREFVHPDDLHNLDEAQRKYVENKGRGLLENEIRLLQADGGYCWVLVKGRAVQWDEDGTPVRISGLTINIQSIKDAQEGMRQSEARFRQLFMSAPIPLVLLSSDMAISAVNDAMIHTFGYRLEDIPDLDHWWRLAYREPEYRRRAKFGWLSDVERALAGNVPVKAHEYRVTCKNGRVLRVRFDTNVFGEMIIVSLYEITELREKEAALQETMERLRATLDATNDGILVVGNNRNVIQANRRFYEMWRIPLDLPNIDQDAALREYVKDQLEDPDGFMDRIDKLYTGRRHEIFEARFKDGRVFDIVSAPMVIAGEETGRVWDFRDITARKKAEDIIDSERKKLRAIFGAMNDVVLICDARGRLVEVVPTKSEFLNRLPDELLGKTVGEIFAPEKVDAFMEAIDRAVSRNETVRLDYELTIGDRSVWFAVALSPMPPDRVVWVARDITARKHAEEQLRQSEEKFSKVFAMAPAVVVVTRFEDGITRDVNDGLEEITGWKKSEVIGRTADEIRFWAEPTNREDHLKELKAGRDLLNREVYFRCKDGSLRNGLYSARSIRLSGELSILSVIQDITEFKKMEADRQKLQNQLSQAQKMEAIGTLAGGVAHDFNNMLGAIIGHTELALDDMDNANPFRETFSTILDAARRSANLTRQLLAFARKEVIKPVLFDINTAVQELLKMMQRLIGENIELRWRPGRGPLIVELDASQLDQVLANLCVNARDAIANIGRITIETESKDFNEDECSFHPECVPGEYVMLSVSDNGCGMDSDTLNHIFEPFFTTKSQGKGTGLGLSTVYGIVRQNKGFIKAYSETGKGTTFSVYFPRKAGAVDVKRKAPKEITGSREETILIVEDDSALLEMTTKMLHRMGYDVLAADAPTKALGLAKETPGKIHMFLSDVVMPEMTGRELGEKLEKIRPGIKHLFMSGYTADVIVHQGVLDEGVNFIHKPFSLQTLSEKIRSVLDE